MTFAGNFLEEELNEVTPASKEEKSNQPINMIARVLKKMGNENSECNQIYKGGKKAREYAQKLAPLTAPFVGLYV